MFYASSVGAIAGQKVTPGLQKFTKRNLCGTLFFLPQYLLIVMGRGLQISFQKTRALALSHYIGLPSNQISTPFTSQSVGRNPIHFSKSQALPFKGC